MAKSGRSAPRSRVGTVGIVLLAFILLAAACSSSENADSDGGSSDTTTGPADADLTRVEGGELIVALDAETNTYSPITGQWAGAGNLIGSAIYDTLAYEMGDGGLGMALAESIEPNDDLTEWTITVKEDIVFHDGSPLNSEVVKANLDARRESPLGAIASADIEEINIVDDRTVTVVMDAPRASYAHSLAGQTGYMVGLATINGDTEDFIGTGPFKFVDREVDASVDVERNPDYWNGSPYLDSIRFEIITDDDSRMNALESGAVDVIWTSNDKSIASVRSDDSLTVLEDTNGTEHIILNTQAPPFDDPLAREILATATNTASLVEVVGAEGVSVASTGPFTSDHPWYLAESGYPEYDPEAARALLAEYEDKTGSPLSFALTAPQPQAALLSALQEQWATLGIEADVQVLEQSAYIAGIFTGNYQAGYFNNFSSLDPDINYFFLYSENADGPVKINMTQLQSEAVDEALLAGRSTLDPDTRRAAYDDLQLALNDEISHVWIMENAIALVSAPDVRGWEIAEERGFGDLSSHQFWPDLWLDR